MIRPRQMVSTVYKASGVHLWCVLPVPGQLLLLTTISLRPKNWMRGPMSRNCNSEFPCSDYGSSFLVCLCMHVPNAGVSCVKSLPLGFLRR